ncbi:MAG TPA: hypothetical protein VHN98_07810 [Acidimicrobiales bacterium]|nr:hypothetical protein [Acidimicrobiales bacterium]
MEPADDIDTTELLRRSNELVRESRRLLDELDTIVAPEPTNDHDDTGRDLPTT